MVNVPKDLFNKYMEKYPLHRTEVIINQMLDDGVITFKDAKELREGKSIFTQDNYFTGDNSNNIDMTKIMGGSFRNNDTSKNNFNREIEPTIQPMTQGDCWLLSDINSLNETDWGKAAIKEAIIPDTNGNGGVTIKFKGSPLEKKEIYITAQEIDKARKSGNYSHGDDDMLAFELATEKTFRQMVKQGLAERTDNDSIMEKMGVKYRSFIFGGVKTDKFEQFPISELLGIETYNLEFLEFNERSQASEEKDKLFKWMSQNKDNISGTCSFAYLFGGYGDENNKDYIHGGHAYAIKEFEYGKDIVISDPHYSDYEIKVPWKIFNEMVQNISFSFKDHNTKERLQNVLPKNIDNYIKETKEYYKQLEKERADKLKEIMKKAKNEDDLKALIDSELGEIKPQPFNE